MDVKNCEQYWSLYNLNELNLVIDGKVCEHNQTEQNSLSKHFKYVIFIAIFVMERPHVEM